MAKTNISFNNKEYQIDEQALSAASADLKSHLSTVMNGTGATITLGGVAYSVDSTKLSAATNAFVSHLGTIAGEAVGGDTLTWDGNTEGLVKAAFPEELGLKCYKVSDAIPTLTDCSNGVQVRFNNGYTDEPSYEAVSGLTSMMGMLCINGSVYVAAYDNQILDMYGGDGEHIYVTFPKAGVYFCYDEGDNRIESLTIHGYTGFGGGSNSGSNVVVGGVEYSIDATKLAGAVTELETVLDGLNSAGGSGADGSLPEAGKTAEEYTWAEIKAIGDAGKAEEYFTLGDIKTMSLTDGTTIAMQIVAFDEDVKADGSGTAAITWISKGIITTHTMNSTDTNEGGWAASGMRTWLQNDFCTTLPTEVQDVIVSVQKTYSDYNGGSHTTNTCEDKVWIPSDYEIYGHIFGSGLEDSGADYTDFFEDSTSRIKLDSSGSPYHWWLRSANSGPRFCVVTYLYGDSGKGAQFATYSLGVVLGFCM